MPGEPPLRINPDVVAQDLGDGLVLLNMRTGIYWGLNRTGAVIWRGIENRASIEKICRQLRDEFESPGQDLEAAVHSLLSELVAGRLIWEAAPAGRQAPQLKKPVAAKSVGKQSARSNIAGKKISRKIPEKE